MDFTSALGLARSLVIYRLDFMHRRRLRGLYSQLVSPGDLAFDVGAHVGDRIDALRGLGCRVVAIEPQPLPLRILTSLYGQTQDVVLEPCALGAEAGTAKLLISRRNPTVSSLSGDWVEATGRIHAFRHVAWDSYFPVKVETLDALIARHGVPQFCKIDVEGFETEVLRGLSQPIPVLSFEFLTAQRSLTQSCLAETARIGEYRYNIAYAEKLKFALPEWLTADGISRHLDALPVSVVSGDIYARLQPSKS